jgi:nicotinamidase-related amidase
MTTIIDEWSSVKPPPAPRLKEVTIDPETTALLMLDLIKQTYNLEQRPRCLESLPNVKKLLTQAKENQMLVVYSLSPGTTEIADTLPEVAPSGKEPFARSGVNKFYQTNLEQVLKEKNIQTLIIVGTAAHGAVLYTASEAVLRGFNVIVPVNGISAENTYIDQYVAYNFANAPIISAKVTLTSTEMMKF